MYSEFLTKATLRFSVGETDILERTTAETQRAQIALQLNQLNADLNLLQAQFQLLLNTPTLFTPLLDDFKMNRIELVDTTTLLQHPTLKLLQQQKVISIRNTQLEKSRLLPDLSFAYNNMSMRGTGADDIVYDGSTRFQSGQIGVGIPLFYGSQKAKINAARSAQRMSETNFALGVKQFNTAYRNALTQYTSYLRTVEYYEQAGLKNATLISETANKQFANGGINYLEWVMLTNQAISIQNEYLNAVNNLNDSLIQLNYFTNN